VLGILKPYLKIQKIAEPKKGVSRTLNTINLNGGEWENIDNINYVAKVNLADGIPVAFYKLTDKRC
jgi:hypothetical protein